jgi:hypothetical protein
MWDLLDSQLRGVDRLSEKVAKTVWVSGHPGGSAFRLEILRSLSPIWVKHVTGKITGWPSPNKFFGS